MENPKDELAGLRTFLAALESRDTTYTRSGVDIKPREIEVLKREIAFLEKILAKGKVREA